MKTLTTILTTFILIVICPNVGAQITTTWTGQNGNLVSNNAIGSVSFQKYEGSGLTTQGGMNSIVQAGSVGITETEVLSFSVYPNPTNGYLFMDLPKNTYVEIYSLQGVLILQTNSHEVDLADLSSGTYIINVQGYNSTLFVKY